MIKDFLNTIEVTSCTESGIQIANVKIWIPQTSNNSTNSGIIIPASAIELFEIIACNKVDK